MNNRIGGLLRAIDKSPKEVEKFHDFHDIPKKDKDMTRKEYNQKWWGCDDRRVP